MTAHPKTVVVVSADPALRSVLSASLEAMRWKVMQVEGGAAAMMHLDGASVEALLLDSWLPDLDPSALIDFVVSSHPSTDLVRFDGTCPPSAGKSRWRYELLHALRTADASPSRASCGQAEIVPSHQPRLGSFTPVALVPSCVAEADQGIVTLLPRIVGTTASMVELARLVRLVAAHPIRVLVEGETGSGKELVARAIHELSPRSAKPFVALNCAAIPESLLEAELFGHTKGAFTGAVQSRTGRIEAAHGGTLFLDEIGELPLALQAKLLRFLENGELQRIGGNETVRVDVRIVSATHRFLDECASAGTFRLDLYHRLSGIPITLPALRDRIGDLGMLASHILKQFGESTPQKKLTHQALEKLQQHFWPGNIRELQNVLQRAMILAENRPVIDVADLLFGRARRM